MKNKLKLLMLPVIAGFIMVSAPAARAENASDNYPVCSQEYVGTWDSQDASDGGFALLYDLIVYMASYGTIMP